MNGIGRLPLILISFILSLTLWLYVQVQENPPKQTPTSFPVQIKAKGLPPNLQVVTMPESIKIFPRGPADEWDRVDSADLSATIDLSRASPGARSYPVRIAVNGELSTLLRWDPKTPEAMVTVDVRTQRFVPVVVQPSSELSSPDELYLSDSTYAEPGQVLVTGPASEVNNVAYARAVLDLSHVSPNRTYVCELALIEAQDRQAPNSVTTDTKAAVVHPGIAVGLQARSVYVLENYKGQPPPGYSVESVTVEPKNVEIRARPDVLSGVSFVRVDVDLAGIKQTTTLNLVPKMPRPDVFLSIPNQPVAVTLTVKPPPPVAKPAQTAPAPRPHGRRRRSAG